MPTNFYNANTALKAVGVKVKFTKQEVQEFLKCKEDPIYFIENYCKIVSLDLGLIPFALYDCQKEKVRTIMNNRKVILMEGRQQGKTITSAACIVHYTLFNDNVTVGILANKGSTAREVLDRYQLMYENLPLWLQQGVVTWNKGDVELENGSKVFTSATTPSAIRGKSVNWLYIDEAAIIPNQIAEEFFTSVYPTIMAGETTKILLSSTPLGYNHFWKFWNDAVNNKNGFKNLFIPYDKIPGRDKAWAEAQRKLLGDVKFNQEILCEFLGSSLTLINGETLRNLSPKPFIYSKDGLDILEKPEPNHKYVIVVDPSKGTGRDYTAMSIFDITEMPYKVVGKYRSNTISILLVPSIIDKIGRDYNNAFVLIEINSGETIPYILHNELEYENLIYVARVKNEGQKITGGFGDKSSALGVTTDVSVKRKGCSILKNLIENNSLLIFDSTIISELTTFISKNGYFSADDGYTDDLVMTCVLFAWLTSDVYFREITDVNIRKELYKKQIQEIEEELTPFGFLNDGNERENPSNF